MCRNDEVLHQVFPFLATSNQRLHLNTWLLFCFFKTEAGHPRKPWNSPNRSRDPPVQFICSPAQQQTLTRTQHLAESTGGGCNRTDFQCLRLHTALKSLSASAHSATSFEHEQTDVRLWGKGKNWEGDHPETLGCMMPKNWDDIRKSLGICERSCHSTHWKVGGLWLGEEEWRSQHHIVSEVRAFLAD